MFIAFQYLCMEYGVNLHGILLHQKSGCLEVTLTLNPLNLSKERCDQMTQFHIVGYLDIGLSPSLHPSECLAIFQTPVGYQGTVPHMSLLNLITRGDTDQLSHQSIHHIGIVL